MRMNEVFNADLPDDLNAELLTVSRSLTAACQDLTTNALAYAQADHEYRKAKALAFLRIKTKEDEKPGKGPTVDHVKAMVDDECEAERLAQRLAQANKEASLELVRSLRVQIGALQSIAAGMRAEMALAGAPEPQWGSGARAD